MLTIEGLLAVLSFGLACFSVGYAIGRKIMTRHRNSRPGLPNLSGYFIA